MAGPARYYRLIGVAAVLVLLLAVAALVIAVFAIGYNAS